MCLWNLAKLKKTDIHAVTLFYTFGWSKNIDHFSVCWFDLAGHFIVTEMSKLSLNFRQICFSYSIQVQNERTKLLCHPLVTYLLRHKWRSCGRYVYYSKLLLYIIYLIFVTGYALTVIPEGYKINCTQVNPRTERCACVPNTNHTYFNPPSASTKIFFIDFGKYTLIILAFISLIIEVFFCFCLFLYCCYLMLLLFLLLTLIL